MFLSADVFVSSLVPNPRTSIVCGYVNVLSMRIFSRDSGGNLPGDRFGGVSALKREREKAKIGSRDKKAIPRDGADYPKQILHHSEEAGCWRY